MLIYNHYYFNIIFNNYKIKDVILKNNIEIKIYLIIYKIQNFSVDYFI